MKTNTDYILRNIVGENVLVPTGTASQKINGMIRLTDTAVDIWKMLDTAPDLEAIVRQIRSEYDVDEETARQDVYGFVEAAVRMGMVSGVPEMGTE